MIPYQSVGREHGMMPAVMANDMKITKEDRIIEHKKGSDRHIQKYPFPNGELTKCYYIRI